MIIPLNALDFFAQAVTCLAVARYAENEPEPQITARDGGRRANFATLHASDGALYEGQYRHDQEQDDR